MATLEVSKNCALSGRGRETCLPLLLPPPRGLGGPRITHLRKGKEKENKSSGGEGLKVVVTWPHNHARGAKPDSTLTGREEGAKEGAKQALDRSKAVVRLSRLLGSSRAYPMAVI